MSVFPNYVKSGSINMFQERQELKVLGLLVHVGDDTNCRQWCFWLLALGIKKVVPWI